MLLQGVLESTLIAQVLAQGVLVLGRGRRVEERLEQVRRDEGLEREPPARRRGESVRHRTRRQEREEGEDAPAEIDAPDPQPLIVPRLAQSRRVVLRPRRQRVRVPIERSAAASKEVSSQVWISGEEDEAREREGETHKALR